jgi:hypothetical protein
MKTKVFVCKQLSFHYSVLQGNANNRNFIVLEGRKSECMNFTNKLLIRYFTQQFYTTKL